MKELRIKSKECKNSNCHFYLEFNNVTHWVQWVTQKVTYV